ncbi:hypothetical protein DQ04_20531010 [Trypanosoma grayi]|uniref:hypothetical protein n=1 Tax=Trypanosoma grayi TaxID=71804 RepID=UPI0004F3F8BA|nr:hypothetical protein DQ04_20531010 [Trypanosoma grayi]KEG05557.1 hypothetical protein DQ04_20531010 [Trypanosoma grayi]
MQQPRRALRFHHAGLPVAVTPDQTPATADNHNAPLDPVELTAHPAIRRRYRLSGPEDAALKGIHNHPQAVLLQVGKKRLLAHHLQEHRTLLRGLVYEARAERAVAADRLPNNGVASLLQPGTAAKLECLASARPVACRVQQLPRGAGGLLCWEHVRQKHPARIAVCALRHLRP